MGPKEDEVREGLSRALARGMSLHYERRARLGSVTWIGTVEAARLLDLTVAEVYRLINDGRLPAYRIGGRIRLRRVDVDDQVHRHRPEQADQPPSS